MSCNIFGQPIEDWECLFTKSFNNGYKIIKIMEG